MTKYLTATAGILICALAVVGSVLQPVAAAEGDQKTRVVIATGGHPFDGKNFFAMWDAFANISYRETSQTKTSEAFTEANLRACDVLVLYDMMANITEDEQAALLAFLKRGGGLVALHHTLCARQQWPEFERIIGGKFLLKPEVREGKKLPQSTAKHGAALRIHIADPKHPITEGLSDFEIKDETYGGFVVSPKVRVLLTTDHPDNTKEVAWVRRDGKARVVFIELGHDDGAYSNPNYRKIVERAVLWAGRKLGEGKAGK